MCNFDFISFRLQISQLFLTKVHFSEKKYQKTFFFKILFVTLHPKNELQQNNLLITP